MILLIDIGNTHTHLGLANDRRVLKRADISTSLWRAGQAVVPVRRFVGNAKIGGISVCSVVPGITGLARKTMRQTWDVPFLELTHQTACGLGFKYPRPQTIGPDRLANAIAARHHYGSPCLVIGFGTAVTFSVVDRLGRFIGGVIAPGCELMTRYLHERTALLPEVRLRRVQRYVGKNTGEAMLIAATHGFRGMVTEIIAGIQRELGCRRLPIVATGGYADFVVRHIPQVTAVEPNLTLEGLRLTWSTRLNAAG